MKPILFNTEMVRAILDGRKTVTRRLVKPQPSGEVDVHYQAAQDEHLIWNILKAPYWVGDILYVRETWVKLYWVDMEGCTHFDKPMYYYAADGAPDIILRDADGFAEEDQRIRWHPSIHMPKEAARIFLRVTDVRLQRLQEIKNEECVAEGAVKKPNYTKRGDLVLHNRYRQEFSELWNTTIKPGYFDRYCWNANPWVWVIKFERCAKPEKWEAE